MLSIAVIGGGALQYHKLVRAGLCEENHQHPIQQAAHRASGSGWWLHHENELKRNLSQRSFS